MVAATQRVGLVRSTTVAGGAGGALITATPQRLQ
jgi:hypothetical protein